MSAYLIQPDGGDAYLSRTAPTEEEFAASIVWRIDAPIHRVTAVRDPPQPSAARPRSSSNVEYVRPRLKISWDVDLFEGYTRPLKIPFHCTAHTFGPDMPKEHMAHLQDVDFRGDEFAFPPMAQFPGSPQWMALIALGEMVGVKNGITIRFFFTPFFAFGDPEKVLETRVAFETQAFS